MSDASSAPGYLINATDDALYAVEHTVSQDGAATTRIVGAAFGRRAAQALLDELATDALARAQGADDRALLVVGNVSKTLLSPGRPAEQWALHPVRVSVGLSAVGTPVANPF